MQQGAQLAGALARAGPLIFSCGGLGSYGTASSTTVRVLYSARRGLLACMHAACTDELSFAALVGLWLGSGWLLPYSECLVPHCTRTAVSYSSYGTVRTGTVVRYSTCTVRTGTAVRGLYIPYGRDFLLKHFGTGIKVPYRRIDL